LVGALLVDAVLLDVMLSEAMLLVLFEAVPPPQPANRAVSSTGMMMYFKLMMTRLKRDYSLELAGDYGQFRAWPSRCGGHRPAW